MVNTTAPIGDNVFLLCRTHNDIEHIGHPAVRPTVVAKINGRVVGWSYDA
jgi:hypothetical protein